MVAIRFFGLLRLELGISSLELEATDISELFRKIIEATNKADINKLKNSVIFINNKNINQLKGYRTKLKPGDEIMFLSPVSGG